MCLFPLERNGAWGWKPYFGKHSAAGDKVSENVYVKNTDFLLFHYSS